MKEVFHVLFNNNGVNVLYCTVYDKDAFLKHLLETTADSILYLFYYYSESVEVIPETKHTLKRIDYDLSPFFDSLTSKHDSLSGSDTDRLVELYNILHTPPNKPMRHTEHSLNQANYLKSLLRPSHSHILEGKKGLEHVCTLMASIPGIDWSPSFLESYSVERVDRIPKTPKNQTITLEHVYYKDKQWYDSSKTPLSIDLFNQDIEYRYFKGSSESIKDSPVISIEEEVVFLDYIYGSYNFGEFWDVVKRLLYCTQKGKPLFCLNLNRIQEIDYYFKTLGYERKYFYDKNKVYYFTKIHVSIMTGTYRGFLDRFDAYSMNRIFNTSPLGGPYVLFLSRGTFSRGMYDEKDILAGLGSIPNLIVLNGSESREAVMYYFTNASVILGVHGSIMKNLVWCRRSPVFINLCLYTLANGDITRNSLNLGFRTFFFVLDCDETARIRLSLSQKKALVELVHHLRWSVPNESNITKTEKE